ncbi:DUF1028 domain-containing protein [Bizionia argentinensis JUB59]|uniref:DUF1028 domain-containing protein n=1 Tax=Bizionia argentinensis JUB59 TaxID=1046627 RepID=G2EC08_9FLAO|nr:DUF1028 domain-containing protein [Bizionia argentinensis]EGV44050.1 DUF1028 domain-containing protein [Bizionia argentinensis JUB59]
MNRLLIISAFLIFQITYSQFYKKSEPFIHTYSIVARDSVTGEMGVAVQSHWFSVGSLAIYGEAGVGVVATQAMVDPSYGPKGLVLMKQGMMPQEALNKLLNGDNGSMFRQVAFLNKNGDVAAHTGSSCIDEAGHFIGKNFSVQANMMLKNTVWDAMAQAFQTSKGTLSERILAAMKAAEAEKGDIRGKQSAAILIVKPEASGNKWEDTVMDLRVEDNENPIVELERLMTIHRAYNFMSKGDIAMEEGDSMAAERHYLMAQQLFPDNLEMQYWYAINLITNKDFDKAKPILKRVFKADSNWKILTQRLVKVNMLIISEADLETVLDL